MIKPQASGRIGESRDAYFATCAIQGQPGSYCSRAAPPCQRNGGGARAGPCASNNGNQT